MNIITIYFKKQRPLLETITQTKPLFMVLIASTLVWIAVVVLAYLLGFAREIPITLITHSPRDPKLAAHFFITDFTNFDIANDRFEAKGELWFDFDPEHYSIDDFKLFNFDHATMLKKSEPKITTLGTLSRAKFEFVANLRTNMNNLDFPFDNHRVDIVLKDILDNKKRSFENENISFDVYSQVINHDWKIYKKENRIGLLKTVSKESAQILSEDLRIVFSIFVKRESPKTAILVLMPLLLIFLIGLTSLSFDVLKNFSAILSLSVGSVTGFLFYRNVIDRMMPATQQFTVVDKIYLLMVLLTVLILGVQIYFLHYFQRLQTDTQLTRLINERISNINIFRGCAFILFALVLLATTAIAIF